MSHKTPGLIIFDPFDAHSMAAACRALAALLEIAPDVVHGTKGSPEWMGSLRKMLPLLALTRSLVGSTVLALDLREIAARLDRVPAIFDAGVEAEVFEAYIENPFYSEGIGDVANAGR